VPALRLVETFVIDEVTHAIEEALQPGMIGCKAVMHQLLCRPGMENYPHLPLARVRVTQAADYLTPSME
jgi:hypothetical protein